MPYPFSAHLRMLRLVRVEAQYETVAPHDAPAATLRLQARSGWVQAPVQIASATGRMNQT